MRLKIDVTDTGVTVQHDGPNGDVVIKAVDPVELARAFAGEVVMDTGWLGPRIHRYMQVGGVTRILVESPPAKRTIKFDDERRVRNTVQEFKNVACPRCVFNFGIRQGQLESSRVCVVNELVPPGMEWIPTDHTPVARFPFPNVYADTRICWGQSQIPTFDLQTVGGLVNLFWASPFNHDLDMNQLPPEWRGHSTPRGKLLFEALAKEPVYPMDLMSRLSTLGQWWRGEVTNRW